MKLKTLLLGSAAALMVTGGAQAADLSIAESVQYVLICDAFGVGYWYIPGTDTCIKIGGFVDFQLKFQSAGWSFGDGDVTDGVNHSSHWKFVTEAGVNFTAKSMTEYGALVGYVALKGVADQGSSTTFGDNVFLDQAYLSLGHVLFGYTDSIQNQPGGFAPGAWRPDTKTNQIQLSWAAAGFGLYLGIEDPSKRWGTELALAAGGFQYSMPDIVGAITVAQGHWDAKITAGWGDLTNGPAGTTNVYGISGTLTAGLDPFKVRVGGAFGTGTSFIGMPGIPAMGNLNGHNMWTAFISGIWQATPQFSLAGTFGYAANSTMATSATRAGAKLVWAPVSGFEAYAEGSAWKPSTATVHNWEAKVGVKRSW